MSAPVTVALLGFAAALAPEDPNAWIYFDGRETAGAPRLIVETGEGGRRETRPDADTVLISYLADRAWGGLPSLSISRSDTNRVLLRFRMEGLKAVERAELVLSLHLSQMPPREDFEIGVHRVLEDWSETDARWSRAPAFELEPAASFVVKPREGELRVDLTTLARGWATGERPNHGLLLKVTKALGGDPSARDAARGRLYEGVALEESVKKALERSKREGKPVLAVVVGSWNPKEPGPHEEHLFATALAHPSVTRLVATRFVPVRLATSPNDYAVAATGGSPPDPLQPLGARLAEVKAPALVVKEGSGARILEKIGTFDHEIVARFLLASLAESPPPKDVEDPWTLLEGGWVDQAEERFRKAGGAGGAVGLSAVADRRGRHEEALDHASRALEEKGAHEALAATRAGVALLRLGRLEEGRARLEKAGANSEAAYWLAVLAALRGEEEASRKSFQTISSDRENPFSKLAASWLAWPERMRIHVSPIAPRLPAPPGVSEVAVSGRREEENLVGLALDYLCQVQNADGSWPLGDPGVEDCRAGVTAIGAHALFSWLGALPVEKKPRVAAALARADGWLRSNVAAADPATLNSFGAAYWLDYVLARQAGAREVQAACDLVMGGRMENGAWSYSKGWGERWKGGIGGWPVTEKGRAHSMNTGLSLEVLARAKAAGARIDEKPLAASVKALLDMRVRPGRFTYTWPEPRNFEEEDASIARGPLCELALWRLSATKREELRRALDLFGEHRPALRLPVKLTGSWLPPHGHSSYFWFFAYYHAAQALLSLSDAKSRGELARMRADLLSVVEPDGTWVDFEGTGKPYGTAMALLLLKQTEPAPR
ncbi:MAG: DNRLRE domain-containing protein [Planctomycetes bacterium]|nr:DNRLRE domain-containing protein [Planctomycetota bacterium]